MNIKNVYFWNYFQRIINSLGGVILVMVISVFYDINDAGEFYALYSILGVVTIFEFGYSVLVLQRMSKYSGIDHSKYNEDFNNDLLHYLNIIKIFICAFIMLFPIIAYFSIRNISSKEIFLIFPLVIFLSINMFTSFISNVIEGLGYIEKVAKIRTIQALFTYGSLIISLAFGLGALAIPIQTFFQSTVFLVLIMYLVKSELSGSYLASDFFKLPSFNSINVAKFKLDTKYSFQLYSTVLASLFCNQVWVIAISVNGAVDSISKVAMLLQIIMAGAGFALTPIASRLAELAKNYHLADTDINCLIKKIVRDVLFSSVAVIVIVVGFYYVGNVLYPEKTLSTEAAIYFIASLPLIIFTNVIGLLIQAKGKRDIFLVSLVRILIPSLFFLYMENSTTSLEIAFYFFVATCIAFIVALSYVYKEIK